jgi:hypothetical protein
MSSEPWSIEGHGSARFSALLIYLGVRPLHLGHSSGYSGA